MRILMLIISSPGEGYDQFKENWKLYMDIHPQIDSFFIEFNEHISCDCEIDHSQRTILFKGRESLIPGCWHKTALALKEFSTGYDYVIRTNLSSLIDFNKLIAYLKQVSSPIYYAGAFCEYGPIKFCSGSMYILSKEVVTFLRENCRVISELPDDVYIGMLISSKYGDIRSDLPLQAYPHISGEPIQYRFRTTCRLEDTKAQLEYICRIYDVIDKDS